MPLNSENEDCRGLCSSIDIRHFPGEEAQQWVVHDPGKILLDVALAVALGGDCLADVAMLRAEPAVFGPVASDPTVSRLIGTLAAGGQRALAAIRTARAEVREGAWKLAGISAPGADGQVIVDLDGVLVIAHSDKEDAAATWKKTYGHHPLMGLVDHGRGGSGELSITQTRLLGILRDREPTMNQLGRHLGLDKSSITGLVDRAQRRGLVTRTVSAVDRRSFQVSITDTGRHLVEQVAAQFAEQIERSVAPLSETDRRLLSRMATRIVTADAHDRGIDPRTTPR